MQVFEQKYACKRIVTKHSDIAVVPFVLIEQRIVDQSVHVIWTTKRIVLAAKYVPIVHIRLSLIHI